MDSSFSAWEKAARVKDVDSGNVDQIIERLEIIASMTGLLHEATIGRIFQHLKSGEPFAIITAYQWPDKEGSRVRNQSLRHELNSAGYSWVRTSGVWHYTDEETGEKVQVIEPGCVVYDIPREDALSFAAKYGQESVVWGSTEEGVWLLFTGGGPPEFLGVRPTMDTISDAWTQLRDSRFTFTGERPQDASPVEVGYQASSLSDAQGWLGRLTQVLYDNCPEYMVKAVLPRCGHPKERP